jgi:hypothetical protein
VENQETPPHQDPSSPTATSPATDPAPAPTGLGKYKLLISLVIVGLIATGYFATRQSAPDAAVGNIVEAAITLVTSDRADVDCAMKDSVDGYHCGFLDQDKPFQVEEKNKLQPFFTVERRLLLIPGLFLDPAVEMRFKSEPPTKPREQLARFVARCQVRIQKAVTDVRVRWLASANFGEPGPAEVATLVDCKIEN